MSVMCLISFRPLERSYFVATCSRDRRE